MENYYVDIDIDEIEKNLICNICQKPFLGPIRTSNRKISCRQCVEASMDKSELTSVSSFSSLHRSGKCILCEEENIEQDAFENHIMKQCSKAVVTCPENGNNCSWIGLREELSTHLEICPSEPSKPKSNEDVQGTFLPYKDINFQDRYFPNQDIAIAVKALLINKRSTCFDLFHKGISSKGASIIASVLHNDTCLETLSLRNNLVCDSGVQFLAHALASNSFLKRLDLNNNSITDTGVRLLVEMLKSNKTLIKLTLSFNRITNEGLDLFIDVLLNHNSTLQWLSLTGNSGIDDSAVPSILSFIRHNQSLTTLNLEQCHLSRLHKAKISFFRKLHFQNSLEILL